MPSHFWNFTAPDIIVLRSWDDDSFVPQNRVVVPSMSLYYHDIVSNVLRNFWEISTYVLNFYGLEIIVSNFCDNNVSSLLLSVHWRGKKSPLTLRGVPYIWQRVLGNLAENPVNLGEVPANFTRDSNDSNNHCTACRRFLTGWNEFSHNVPESFTIIRNKRRFKHVVYSNMKSIADWV